MVHIDVNHHPFHYYIDDDDYNANEEEDSRIREKREKRLAREEKKKSKSRLTDVTQSSIKEKWSKRKPLNLDRIMDGLREVGCCICSLGENIFLIQHTVYAILIPFNEICSSQRTLNGDTEPNIWSIRAGPSKYPPRKFCTICGGEG